MGLWPYKYLEVSRRNQNLWPADGTLYLPGCQQTVSQSLACRWGPIPTWTSANRITISGLQMGPYTYLDVSRWYHNIWPADGAIRTPAVLSQGQHHVQHRQTLYSRIPCLVPDRMGKIFI
ncbi:hypothetical protein DPMN_073261 [Dreissena polymorpha]|uniref:Uncharacterized protein n=1 Tax=Dreissena polymorpha TaxID=45954 RepID=A0A9D4BYS3_DREPO|nr:hypothetical protein DPMN_073261 [Dreissena polymorpha]